MAKYRDAKSTLATGVLQDHLDTLDTLKHERGQVPGAVFIFGSHALVEAEHNGTPWLVRLQCELPRPELAARATYVGTGKPSENAEYARFVRAASAVGIKACCRLRCDVKESDEATARALAFLEQSDLIWFGDTGPPEKVWAAIARAAGGVAERVRWRHKHGAVLVGVGKGGMLLGKTGWEYIDLTRYPSDTRHETYKELDDPKTRTLFESIGAIDKVFCREFKEEPKEVRSLTVTRPLRYRRRSRRSSRK